MLARGKPRWDLRHDDQLRPGAVRLSTPRVGGRFERYTLDVELDVACDRVSYEAPILLRELVGRDEEVRVSEDRQVLEAHGSRSELGGRASGLTEIDDRGVRHGRLNGCGRPALARRYASRWHQDVLRAVQNKPRPLLNLLGDEAAVVNALVGLGSGRGMRAVKPFARSAGMALRTMYGEDLRELALRLLEEATRTLETKVCSTV